MSFTVLPEYDAKQDVVRARIIRHIGSVNHLWPRRHAGYIQKNQRLRIASDVSPCS